MDRIIGDLRVRISQPISDRLKIQNYFELVNILHTFYFTLISNGHFHNFYTFWLRVSLYSRFVKTNCGYKFKM